MTASGYFVNEYPNATIWNDRHVVLHDADCHQARERKGKGWSDLLVDDNAVKAHVKSLGYDLITFCGTCKISQFGNQR